MPYIDQEKRDKITRGNTEMIDRYNVTTPGDIQYVIALLLKDYLEYNGLSYKTCNDLMGTLAGAQMEFYRKVVGPYEAEKEKENGGIY